MKTSVSTSSPFVMRSANFTGFVSGIIRDSCVGHSEPVWLSRVVSRLRFGRIGIRLSAGVGNFYIFLHCVCMSAWVGCLVSGLTRIKPAE